MKFRGNLFSDLLNFLFYVVLHEIVEKMEHFNIVCKNRKIVCNSKYNLPVFLLIHSTDNLATGFIICLPDIYIEIFINQFYHTKCRICSIVRALNETQKKDHSVLIYFYVPYILREFI